MSGAQATNDQAVQFEMQQAADAQQKEQEREARLAAGTKLINSLFDPVTDPKTGKQTGGFGDDFYNAYKQKYLDYYQPDEARQYGFAKRDLTYNLARAGLTNSTAAADNQGELAYQDAINKASIASNANDVTGQLKDQVLSEKQSLINQLYATEDPTLTANLAQSSANALNLKTPTLTPAAALFTPLAVGASAAASAYASPYGQTQPLYGYGYGGYSGGNPTSATGSGSGRYYADT